MKELYNSIITTYEQYRGSGKVFVLFLVALLAIFLFNEAKDETGKGRNIHPGLFLLSIPTAICYALGLMYKKLRSNEIKICEKFLVLFLTVLIFVFYGSRTFSEDFFEPADNMYHVNREYIDAFEAILNDREGTKNVVASKEISPYLKMYSSSFNTMFDYEKNGDFSGLDSDARYVLEQLQSSTPDEERVVKIMRKNGFDYIIIDTSRNYFELPLEEYGFVLISAVGDLKVYKDGVGK